MLQESRSVAFTNVFQPVRGLKSSFWMSRHCSRARMTRAVRSSGSTSDSIAHVKCLSSCKPTSTHWWAMPVRYVGLLWSLIIIEHLYLSGIWQGFWLRTEPERHLLWGDWILCAQNIDTILGAIVGIKGRTLCESLKERIFSLWPPITFTIQLQSWTWNDNLCGLSQLSTRWDNFRSDLPAKIVCGIGNAHNRVRYLNLCKS